MTTSREQLLALVQRRGQAQKAIKLFISLMSSSVDVRNPDKALSACLKLLESAVGTRQPSWTQILVVEGGSGGQKGDKKTAVCAAKVAQSLIKAYAATNVAATTSEEMEDLVAAMDLACMALYVACALEHMVQLGDLVVDNLLYQVAKKYADMPGARAASSCVAACVHIRLWSAHAAGDKESGNLSGCGSQFLTSLCLNGDITGEVVKKIELLTEFPRPKSYHTPQFTRLLLGHTNTCVTSLAALKRHKAVLLVANNTLSPWITHLRCLSVQDAKLASSFNDRTFRILWKCATAVEGIRQKNPERSTEALQFRASALSFLIKCSNYTSLYFIQQVNRVGVQHERASKRSSLGMQELHAFYSKSATILAQTAPTSPYLFTSKSLEWGYIQWLEHFSTVCENLGLDLENVIILENAFQYSLRFGTAGEPIQACVLFTIAGALLRAAGSAKRSGCLPFQNGMKGSVLQKKLEAGTSRIIRDLTHNTSSESYEKTARVCLKKLEALTPCSFATLAQNQPGFVSFVTRCLKRSSVKLFNYIIHIQHTVKYQLCGQVVSSFNEICRAVKEIRSAVPAADKSIVEGLILDESRIHRMAVVLLMRHSTSDSVASPKLPHDMVCGHINCVRELLDETTKDGKPSELILQGVLGDINSIARECYGFATRCFKTRNYPETTAALTGAFELADSYLEYVMCSNLTVEEIHDAHAQLKVDSIVSLLAYCYHELGDIPQARKFIGYSLLYCGEINAKIPHDDVDKYASLTLEELAISRSDHVEIILNDYKVFVDNANHVFKARHIVEHQIAGLWRAFRAAFEKLSAKIMIDLRAKNCEEPDISKEVPSELSMKLCSALENFMDVVIMKYTTIPGDEECNAILMEVSHALTTRKAIYCNYYAKRDPKGAIEGLIQARQTLSDATEKLRAFRGVDNDLGGVYGWRGVITMEITLITSYTSEPTNGIGCSSVNEETAIADIEQCLMHWGGSDDVCGFLFDRPRVICCLESICNSLSLISCSALEKVARDLLKAVQLAEVKLDGAVSVIPPPLLSLLGAPVDEGTYRVADAKIGKYVFSDGESDILQHLEQFDAQVAAAAVSNFADDRSQAYRQLLNASNVLHDTKLCLGKKLSAPMIAKAMGVRELLIHVVLSDIHFRDGQIKYAISEAKTALRICWKLSRKFATTSSASEATYFELPPEITIARGNDSQLGGSAHLLPFKALECSSWDLLFIAKFSLCQIASLFSYSGQLHRAATYYYEAMRLVGGLDLRFFRRSPFYEYAALELNARHLAKAKVAVSLLSSSSEVKQVVDEHTPVSQSCFQTDSVIIEQNCHEIVQRGDILLLEGDHQRALACYTEAVHSLACLEHSASRMLASARSRCWRKITRLKAQTIDFSNAAAVEELLASMKQLKRSMKECDKTLDRVKSMIELGRTNVQMLRSSSPRAFVNLDKTLTLLEDAYVLGDHLGIPDLSRDLRATLGIAYFTGLEECANNEHDLMDGGNRSNFLSWASGSLLANASFVDVIKDTSSDVADTNNLEKESLTNQLKRMAADTTSNQVYPPLKHLKARVTPIAEKVKALPDTWMIVSLMIGLSSELMVTRFLTNGEPPISFCLPNVAWVKCMQEIDKIISNSRGVLSGHTAEEAGTWNSGRKKAWWNTRKNLNDRLEKTIISMQETFGFWRCLLIKGSNTMNSEKIQRCWDLLTSSKVGPIKLATRNQTLLCAIADAQQWLTDSEVLDGINHIAAEIEAPMSETMAREAVLVLRQCDRGRDSISSVAAHAAQSDPLSKLTVGNITKMKVGEVKEYLAAVGLSTDGLKKVLVERLVAAREAALSASLRTNKKYGISDMGSTEPTCSTILILNHQLHEFPWEGIDVMGGCSGVTRMLSLDLILQNANRAAPGTALRRDRVRFLLNPAGDLKSTQTQLEPVLENGATTLGWKGIIGEVPDPDELRNYLLDADLFIYCGHGSGEAYLHRDKILSLQGDCSAALLFGCSSGRLEQEGIFGPSGAVLSYLRAGSPAVVAMLWDVTDKDTDQLSVRILQEWLLADFEERDGNCSRSLAQVLQDSRDIEQLGFVCATFPEAAVKQSCPIGCLEAMKSGTCSLTSDVAGRDDVANGDICDTSCTSAGSSSSSPPPIWQSPQVWTQVVVIMVLICSTPPAPLPVDVAATRPLVQEIATSTAARAHVRVLASSTYGRCVLGLAGFLKAVTGHMAAFMTCMDGEAIPENVALMHELLLLLAETVVDEDNATYFARIGGHPLLMRLMEHESEDIQEAAAEVVTSCTTSPSAISFPHRVRQVGEVELLWPRAVPLPLDPRDNVPKSADGSHNVMEVLIRQVPTRMTGQRKTGYLLWGAAFVLARWIHIHRELFEGKSVIEVGSGLGLGGITAARYASHTTLTDYQSDTCTALDYNIKLNRPFTHEFDPTKAEVAVSLLDWDLTESIEAVPKAEIVVASDIICEPSTAEGFLRVVRHHVLKNPDGVAYLMNANSHSRFGVTHLHALLAASTDLSYSITPVGELPDGAQLLETVSDAQELSYEFYEIRAAKC